MMMTNNSKSMLFATQMARSARAGIKTETRRMDGLAAVNDKPDEWTFTLLANQTRMKDWEKAKPWRLGADFVNKDGITETCYYPYGHVGDRLWVKETYAKVDGKIIYRADGDVPISMRDWAWTGGIYMPQVYARTYLEIVDVAVERLRDITEAGAKREGVDSVLDFFLLWDQINHKHRVTPDKVNYNPWVWVTRFRLI